MHPAFSVIFLTTLIGAAQGLFLALFTAQSYAAFKLLPQPDAHNFYGQGSVLRWLLLVAGLGASFFHLGHPERAWRAASKWRTSWLSREVIVLPAFMGVVFLYGLAHWLDWHPVLMTLPGGLPVDPTAILGVAGTVLAFALFVCTAMIYACLKFLAEWHSPLTVINYILLGGASGFTLAAAFAPRRHRNWSVSSPAGRRSSPSARLHLALPSLYRNARLKPKSTLQTAIGIKHPKIVQKAQGFMGGSFNTREFFHGSRLRCCGGEVVFPAGRLSAAAFVVVVWNARRHRRAGSGLRGAVCSACWPSAGSSSPRPIIRRTCITSR
jgi:DMSO reductase anchor subunit